MRTESKLASLWGVFQKLSLHDVMQSARRVIEATPERGVSRPLRDIDDWSDQSEVAYYEEVLARRA